VFLAPTAPVVEHHAGKLGTFADPCRVAHEQPLSAAIGELLIVRLPRQGDRLKLDVGQAPLFNDFRGDAGLALDLGRANGGHRRRFGQLGRVLLGARERRSGAVGLKRVVGELGFLVGRVLDRDLAYL